MIMNKRKCNICNEYKEEVEYTPSSWKQPKHYNIFCRECNRNRNKPKHKIRNGYIYIMTNKAWKHWCKIGLTTKKTEQRLKTYQTGSPFRDYEIYASKKINDIVEAEIKIHNKLEKDGYKRKLEWFNIEPEVAFTYLNELQ